MDGVELVAKGRPETWGDRLELLRLALKISKQKDFAEQLGIDPTLYNHYIKGKVKRVPYELITDVLLPMYKVDSNYIVHGDMRGLPHGLAMDIAAARRKYRPLGGLEMAPGRY